MGNYKIRRRLTSALLVLCMSAVTPVTVLADPTDDILLDTVDETDIGMEYQDDSYDEMIISEPADDEIMPDLADDIGMYKSVDADKVDDNGDNPAEMADYYTVDDVTFYKVTNNNFSKSATDFYRDVLNAKMETVPAKNGYERTRQKHTPRLYWTKIAGAIARQKWGSAYGNTGLGDVIIDVFSGDEKTFEDGATDAMKYNGWGLKKTEFNNAASMKKAEQEMLNNFPISGSVLSACGKYQSGSEAENGPVFYRSVWGSEADGKAANLIAVVFSDFQVVPLLPDDSGNNYVSTTIEDTSVESVAKATEMVNYTALTDNTHSQTITEGQTSSVGSEVNGSQNYSFTEALTLGVEFGFPLAGTVKAETSFSSTQELQHGWTKTKSEEHQDLIERSLSATLFPYTGAMLKQTTKTQKVKTSYNCPVAVYYRVRVLQYRAGYSKNFGKFLDAQAHVYADFKPKAQADLNERYLVEGHNHNDIDDINWAADIFRKSDYKIPFILQSMATLVPIASTPASFTETLQ